MEWITNKFKNEVPKDTPNYTTLWVSEKDGKFMVSNIEIPNYTKYTYDKNCWTRKDK